MKFVSTKNNCPNVSLKQAVFQGLAPDEGLYFPETLPQLSIKEFETIADKPFNEMAFHILKHFALPEMENNQLKEIIDLAFDFEPKLVEINDNQYILELFHGPTLAFKDFGANLLASLMCTLLNKDERLTILVATSGDTGSAVAHAFHNKPNIDVVILFPKGKISDNQEKQFSTLGNNVYSLAIDGTFDDCQALAKKSFMDTPFKEKHSLSSANSINIGRLLPQSLYYAYAYAQLLTKNKKVIFSVPSGNIGNLTSGLLVSKMYQFNCHFIAALNNNKVFHDYLNSGNYSPRPSVETLANAMDVGDPSNFDRLNFFYKQDVNNFRKDITSYSFNDDDTLRLIKDCWQKNQYLVDPHTAISYGGSLQFAQKSKDVVSSVTLATADPSKFPDVIEKAVNLTPKIPERLQICLNKKSQSIDCSVGYNTFKEKINSLLSL